ncbi:hypothetical protein GC722_06465 [Auraticoccus sp. F435]|uniref:Uncharacterized protein n=1 Tax=Auraticoccus cholistanensis TaxID=2656650 RepID=A0A6A9USR8_9ACTN|nr:hypothetical protein [Auraticoccus cholistanensis]MVA75668.1 hypothetical protein [Auraticoccus cholistanensis]
MAVDDWSWFFASEHGRDRMLREELESTSAAAQAARAQAWRLRSQLAQVQGSMEKRLTALSRAFDAYVELGHVRERLMDFGDTRLVRRDAARAVEALAAGHVPSPLDPADYESGYWLLDAVNAVVAVAAGRRDPELEERVVRGGRSGALFLVGCATALGHGAQVVDRLPATTTVDEAFDPASRVLADAAAAGLLGPAGLATLDPVVTAALARDADGWTQWLHDASGTDAVDAQLVWLEDHLAADPGPDAPAPQDAARVDEITGRLRALTSSLVAEGSDEERELLARAASLRHRIQHPEEEETAAPAEDGDRVLVRDWVLELARQPASAAGRQAREWLRAPLAALVERIPASPPRPERTASVVVDGWRIQAGEQGVDTEVVRRSRATVRDAELVRPASVTGCWVAGGLASLVGVLVLVDAVGAGTALLVAGLVLLALGFLLRERARAAHAREQQRQLAALEDAVRAAEQEASRLREEGARADAEHRARRERLLDRLAQPVGVTG